MVNKIIALQNGPSSVDDNSLHNELKTLEARLSIVIKEVESTLSFRAIFDRLEDLQSLLVDCKKYRQKLKLSSKTNLMHAQNLESINKILKSTRDTNNKILARIECLIKKKPYGIPSKLKVNISREIVILLWGSFNKQHSSNLKRIDKESKKLLDHKKLKINRISVNIRNSEILQSKIIKCIELFRPKSKEYKENIKDFVIWGNNGNHEDRISELSPKELLHLTFDLNYENKLNIVELIYLWKTSIPADLELLKGLIKQDLLS